MPAPVLRVAAGCGGAALEERMAETSRTWKCCAAKKETCETCVEKGNDEGEYARGQ